MQLELQKTHRIIAIVLALILSVAGFITAWQYHNKTEQIEEKYQILNYTLTPDVKLEITIDENDFYEGTKLSDDQVVVTSLLKHIDVDAKMTLKVPDADATELKMTQVERLETYYGEEKKVIWQRELMPVVKSLEGKKELEIAVEKRFNPDEFKSFLAKISEDLELTPEARLFIVWTVEGQAVKGENKLSISEEFRLPIDLFSNMFVVDKAPLAARSSSKEIVEKSTRRVYPQLHLVGLAVGILGLIALALLSFVVKSKSINSYQRIKTNGLKNYSDRLVQLEQPLPNDEQSFRTIYSLEDLVKMADELRKPILYYDDKQNQSIRYYISSGHVLYLFQISADNQSDSEEPKRVGDTSNGGGNNVEDDN